MQGPGLAISLPWAAAFTLALAITLSRKSPADMSLAPGLGRSDFRGLCPAHGDLSITSHREAGSGCLSTRQLCWFHLPAICLAAAPRFIPAPQVAIFYLLETVLAPIWVWIAFGEKIETATLIGGAIVLAAIVGIPYGN